MLAGASPGRWSFARHCQGDYLGQHSRTGRLPAFRRVAARCGPAPGTARPGDRRPRGQRAGGLLAAARRPGGRHHAQGAALLLRRARRPARAGRRPVARAAHRGRAGRRGRRAGQPAAGRPGARHLACPGGRAVAGAGAGHGPDDVRPGPLCGARRDGIGAVPARAAVAVPGRLAGPAQAGSLRDDPGRAARAAHRVDDQRGHRRGGGRAGRAGPCAGARGGGRERRGPATPPAPGHPRPSRPQAIPPAPGYPQPPLARM